MESDTIGPTPETDQVRLIGRRRWPLAWREMQWCRRCAVCRLSLGHFICYAWLNSELQEMPALRPGCVRCPIDVSAGTEKVWGSRGSAAIPAVAPFRTRAV